MTKAPTKAAMGEPVDIMKAVTVTATQIEEKQAEHVQRTSAAIEEALKAETARAERAEALLEKLRAEPVPDTPAPVPVVKRMRFNRGNTRRILRALEAFTKACDDAAKDFDLLAYAADDEGKRIGEWPTLAAIRTAKAEVQRAANALISGEA